MGKHDKDKAQIRDPRYSFECCYDDLHGDVENIWKKLISTRGFRNVVGLFSEALDLFREALKCYCNGAFLATLIVCRVTVETTLYYLALTGRVRKGEIDNESVIVEKWIDKEFMYLDRKRRVEPGDWELLKNKLREKGYLTGDIEELYKNIRERGNYAAHWGERARKKMLNYIKQLFENKNPEIGHSTLEIWPTRNEALTQLNDTVTILSRLIENVYKKEILEE